MSDEGVSPCSEHAASDRFRLETTCAIEAEELRELYESVGWTVYSRDPDTLRAAIEGSDFVVTARDGAALIGLARVLSDDVSLAYLQDVLVSPSRQGQGVGKALVAAVLERYRHVPRKLLLTDDRPDQIGFYTSLGFTELRQLESGRLNFFLLLEGER